MSLVEIYWFTPRLTEDRNYWDDHLQETVEISIHEFTPFGSRDHIPLCASYS